MLICLNVPHESWLSSSASCCFTASSRHTCLRFPWKQRGEMDFWENGGGGGRRGAVGWMPEEGAALCCDFTSCITGCSTSLPALHHLRRLICLKAPRGEQQSWKHQTWFSCSVCPFWIEGCKRRIHAGGVWTVVHHNVLSVSEFSHEGRTQGVDSRPGATGHPLLWQRHSIFCTLFFVFTQCVADSSATTKSTQMHLIFPEDQQGVSEYSVDPIPNL